MQMRNRGFFITFEGLDKVGKTTQATHLYYSLKKAGYDCVLTCEPGGTAFGARLESLLKDRRNNLNARTELLTVMAARSEHMEKVINPALERGQIVICDRFVDSTFAYQGASGIKESRIRKLHDLFFDKFYPDLTILLTSDNITSDNSALSFPDYNDTFESRGDAYRKKVQEIYESIAVREPTRVVKISIDNTESYINDSVFFEAISLICKRHIQLYTS